MSPENEFVPPDVGALQAEGGTEQTETASGDSAVAAVLEREMDRLMKIEGVVMVGEGLDDTARPAIVIGVKQRHHIANLPKNIDGVPVVGWLIGEVDALTR